jgi:hypothetical protein
MEPTDAQRAELIGLVKDRYVYPEIQVTRHCFPRRRAKEFLTFMKEIARQYEGQELHVVLDNLSTHFSEEIERWLAKNPAGSVHLASQLATHSVSERAHRSPMLP